MPSRRYTQRVDQIAVDYAKATLGYTDPVIYGSQVDPKVAGVYALWLKERACKRVVIGLIVCADRGVLDEFDPRDHAPGTLRSKAHPTLVGEVLS